MAVLNGATATGTGAGVSSITTGTLTRSGSNIYLYGIVAYDAGVTVSSMTYNGNPMTFMATVASVNVAVDVYKYGDPGADATGTVTFSGTANSGVFGLIQVKNADIYSPTTQIQTATGSDAAPTATVNANGSLNNAVIGGCAVHIGTSGAGVTPAGTVGWNTTAGSGGAVREGGQGLIRDKALPATTVTWTGTITTPREWALIIFDVLQPQSRFMRDVLNSSGGVIPAPFKYGA